MSTPVFILTLATALGCALVGGVFFAFSSFVMPALARLRPPDGIAAMQAINVTAETPVFMAAFVGTAVACVGLIAVSIADRSGYLLAGALLYLVGGFGITAGYHVPRNNALARVDPGTAEAERDWTRYLREWCAANHVRAVAALAAAGLMIAAVRVA
jgi:uncharacterized membrane protein